MIIIEDEAFLRSSLMRGLNRNDLEIVGVGTLQEGLDAIDACTPDLILSDIDLPDRSGIELIGELGRRGLNVPVIYMSAYLKAYCAQIPRHANVEVIEKPVALAEIRKIVASRLRAKSTVESPFTVVDYLQLSCMGGHTVRIGIAGEGNREIIIVKGELWSAIDGEVVGAEAFSRLVTTGWKGVVCESLEGPPPERTIEEDWQGLLLDALREQDEREAQRVPSGESVAQDDEVSFHGLIDDEPGNAETSFEMAPPDPMSIPAPVSEPVDATQARPGSDSKDVELQTLLEEATEAILDKRYDEALLLLRRAQEIAPNNDRVVANLERLEALRVEDKEKE